MALSIKDRRVISAVLAVFLWLAVLLFFAVALFPSLQNYFELRRELAAEEARFREILREPDFPTEGAVRSAREMLEVIETELDESRDFYLDLQRRVLDRKPLESDRDSDSYMVAAKFRELKRNLEERAGYSDFLDLGGVAAWQRDTAGRPHPDHYPLLEKKSRIAEVLVHVLTGHFGRVRIVVSSMEVGDPYTPGHMASEDSHEHLRYRVFPVNITMRVPLRAAERLLNNLLSVTPDSEKPFTAIRYLELDMREGPVEGGYTLRMGLNVLDFYMPDIP